MSGPERIDVHQHIVPPVWAQALAELNLDPGAWAVPEWTPNKALDVMGRHGIKKGILSVTAPGTHLGDDAKAHDLTRRVNDYSAEIARAYPAEVGFFASLPLPDVGAALAETARAIEELGADGVVLMSNSSGQYLGDPMLEELWQELNRRRTVVFVHPARPPLNMMPGIPAPIVDFPFDTTRTAADLVRANVLTRYPEMPIILAHAGGFLPYVAHRIAALSSVVDSTRTVESVLEQLRLFHFDTALSTSPAALAALLNFAQPDRVLYGSDWPFAPESLTRYFNTLWENADLPANVVKAINRKNATNLFARPR